MKELYKLMLVLATLVWLSPYVEASSAASSASTLQSEGGHSPEAATTKNDSRQHTNRSASGVTQKIESFANKVGHKINGAVQKTGHALERAGHWIEEKVNRVRGSGKNE